MSNKERDLIVALDSGVARSGSKAQIHYALEQGERRGCRGLTLEEIADITGLTPGTTYVRLRELFHASVVEEIRTSEQRVYRLAESKQDLSIASPEARPTSLEDVRKR